MDDWKSSRRYYSEYNPKELNDRQELRRAMSDWEKKRLVSFARELSEKDEVMEAVYSLLHLGIVRINFNADGTYASCEWSYAARRLLGYTDTNDFPDDIMQFRKKIHPEDRKMADKQYENDAIKIRDKSVNEDDLKFSSVFRVLNKNGSYRWYSLTGLCIRDEKSIPITYYGILMDIHEQYERKLEYDMIINNAKEVYGAIGCGTWQLYFDKDGNEESFTIDNELKRYFGFEDLDNYPYENNGMAGVHPEDRTRISNQIKAVLERRCNHDIFDEQYRLIMSTGECKWYRSIGRLMMYEDGRMAIHGILADIDSKVKAYKRLEKSVETSKWNEKALEGIHHAMGSVQWNAKIDSEGVRHPNLKNYEVPGLFGYDEEDEYPGEDRIFSPEFINKKDYRGFADAYNQLISCQDEGYVMNQDVRIRCRDGMYHWFKLAATAAHVNDDPEITIYGAIIDIDREKKLESQRRKHLSIVESLCSEYADIFIIDFDKGESTPIKVRGQMREEQIAKKYQYDETWDDYIRKYVVREDKARVRKAFKEVAVRQKLAQKGEFTYQYKVQIGEVCHNMMAKYVRIPAEGERREFIVAGYKYYDNEVRALEERQQMLNLSERDFLTGVYTRAHFVEKAKKILKKNPNKHYDLIISDFENFKEFNSRYGSGAGDELLAASGKKLCELEGKGTLIGRYGGDQFVVLVEKSQRNALVEAEKLFFSESTNGVFSTVVTKFGVISDIDHSSDVTVSCDRALMALNSIKNKYGIRVKYFDEEMRQTAEYEKQLEATMKASIKNGYFKVFYQPKHEAATGKLVGAEALVRLVHPELGFVGPDKFIPLFERNGFIITLDKYVWERTCINISNWQKEGIETVPISVNASKLDFSDEKFFTNLTRIALKNKVSKEKLHIEVTETLAAENTENIVKILSDLRNEGYQIELDDFGKGYSSLAIVSELPLDVLKLDMQFAKDTSKEKKISVIKSCVGLGKALGLKIISEGVENEEQLERLRELGVDAIQGYYYSKPISEDEFKEYLISHEH